MNLLQNKKSDQNGRMTEEILRILSNISKENLEIAIKFFDFSKEMNLELLKEVKHENMTSYKVASGSPAYTFLFNTTVGRDDYNEYTDRYILFLDALGDNTIGNMLSYNFCTHYENKYDSLAERVHHAFSRRYEPYDVQCNILALFAESSDNSFPPKLIDTAKENPVILFDTAEQFCHGEYVNAELKLYSLALAYLNPVEITENSTEEEKKLAEYIKKATDLILKAVSKNDSTNDNVINFISMVCFLSCHHEPKIKQLLLNIIARKNHKNKFLRVVLNEIPTSYFEKNIDILFEVLGFDKDPSFVVETLKHRLSEFGLGDGNRCRANCPFRMELLLRAIAKKYPKQFIEVMYLADRVKHPRYSAQYIVLCDYYPELYKILEKENPESIKENDIDFDRDVVWLTILGEEASTSGYKNKISDYLSGKIEFSALPSATGLGGCLRHSAKENLLKFSLKVNPDFRNRYIALKSRQYPQDVRSLITNDIITYKDVVHALIAEKVPIEDRFTCYNEIYEWICYREKEQQEMKKQVSSAMAKLFETRKNEYAEFCPLDSIFARLVYLSCLDMTNTDNQNKDTILGMCRDTSKEVRSFAVEIIAKYKDYENEVLELLKSKKITVREAAVEVLSVWGTEKYKEILMEAAEKEKSAKLADKIHSVLNITSTPENDEEGAVSPIRLVESLHKGGRNRKILWLYAKELKDVVHFNNGNEADEKYLQAIMLCYSSMDIPGVNDNAVILARELNQDELNKFAAEIFSRWIEDGAESKKKWVLYFCSIHGGHNMIEALLHYIKEWSENSRGAIAAEAVRALAFNGSSEALMAVDNMAHKFKHKQVKSAAVQALEKAAEELGITTDELGDRIVPDLGFNENMESIFDYGTRKFKVYLTPALELEVYDENDKKLKTMPAPSKKDDEEIAKKSNAEFKQMKKQLKNVISIQKLRLETALLADRRWNVEAWNNLFVKNPVMHCFATGLIWAAYENNYELVQTFRYMEDGSFNTSDEDEYTLPDNCTIGLVHPIDLSEDELSAWKEQLGDYEITQPIEQLERTIYRIKEEEIGKLDLKRFEGRKIGALTLLGRITKLGWYKGSVQDAGIFSTFYREDVTQRIKNDDGSVRLVGNGVELNFSGMYVGAYDVSEEEVTIENVRFYAPGTVRRGSYVYDEADDKKAKKLDKISPRYFSEIINQIEAVLKGTEET